MLRGDLLKCSSLSLGNRQRCVLSSLVWYFMKSELVQENKRKKWKLERWGKEKTISICGGQDCLHSLTSTLEPAKEIEKGCKIRST